jgi:hypothetical protein
MIGIVTALVAAAAIALTAASGDRYEAVVTQRVLQAKTATTPLIVQPALTLYKRSGGSRVKVWTAPPSIIPKVTRVSNYPMGWQPLQLQVSALSAASLMAGRGQQLVVGVHESSADCGMASVHVIELANGSARLVATVENFCDLASAVAGNTLVLTGPGYGPNDALCCPSKPKAQAKLAYARGGWSLQPKSFKLTVAPQ